MPANGVVILLSPIFIGLAGWIVDLCARYLPGHPALDSKELTVVFLAGATCAASKILVWLHGRTKIQGTKIQARDEQSKPVGSTPAVAPAGQTGTGTTVAIPVPAVNITASSPVSTSVSRAPAPSPPPAA